MDLKSRWTELVETMATGKDPEKLRLVCEEIDRISEQQESESKRRMHREQLPSSCSFLRGTSEMQLKELAELVSTSAL